MKTTRNRGEREKNKTLTELVQVKNQQTCLPQIADLTEQSGNPRKSQELSDMHLSNSEREGSCGGKPDYSERMFQFIKKGLTKKDKDGPRTNKIFKMRKVRVQFSKTCSSNTHKSCGLRLMAWMKSGLIH